LENSDLIRLTEISHDDRLKVKELKRVLESFISRGGVLTHRQRKKLGRKFAYQVSKIYKIEWQIKSKLFYQGREIVGYPNDQEMTRLMDKFRSWNRSKRHHNKLTLFKI
jgi:hypothetical protein